MSHEIESAVFMASEGAGWTGLGRAIPLEIAQDPAAIAALCNATWTVNTMPVYTKNADGTYSEADGFAAQVRSDNNHILSLTSDDKYHVEHRQPLDVFEAFRDKLAAHELDISHASVLRGGAVIAVSAILPSEFNVTVGRGDVLKSYVTLSTGYDKKHGTKATKGSIRVVCANTLAYSIADALRTGKIRTVKASSHMDEMTLKDLIANVETMVEAERAQLLRQTFGTRDAVMALPAPSLAAMLWYAEHWNGALKDTVRGLAACHATGTPFGPDDNGNTGDGGVKARLAPLAPAPIAPTGASFEHAQVQSC